MATRSRAPHQLWQRASAMGRRDGGAKRGALVGEPRDEARRDDRDVVA